MRPANEDEPCTKKPAIDLVSAVTELHALSSPDLSKLIRNAENGIIRWTKVDGSSFEINVESLARYLALHLITKLLSVKGDQQQFRYLLGGDLCEEGGALLLVQDIMKLPPCDDSHLMAGVSRLKSKVLSIMLHLCETEVESDCFLDLAASITVGLDLAKATVFQVLEVLKIMFCGDPKGPSACSFKGHPRGLLQLNAMRLTEIFSDDSNYRSYILLNFEEGFFVNKFLQYLQKGLPKLLDGERTAAACINMYSLLLHAESLREHLNEDDVQLLRVQKLLLPS